MQICFSGSRAATSDTCRSNFVIYMNYQWMLPEQLTTPFPGTQGKPGAAEPQHPAAGAGGHPAAGSCPSLKAQKRGVKEGAYLA